MYDHAPVDNPFSRLCGKSLVDSNVYGMIYSHDHVRAIADLSIMGTQLVDCGWRQASIIPRSALNIEIVVEMLRRLYPPMQSS
jgi:hypothetical protein